MTAGVRLATVLGGACAFAVLLSPAVLPSADAVLPAVLPSAFFVAGATAQVLRPGHPVGARLLAVGVLHLAALLGGLVVALQPDGEIALPVAWVSVTLYALGFVALLDLLARYPTGRYAWAPVRGVVRAAAVLAVVLATVAVLGSPAIPSVLELETAPNPLNVAALAPLTSSVTGTALLPVAGLVLLLARYHGAPALDRSQMRWPIVTAGILAVGLVTTAQAEAALGPQVQTAVFLVSAAALPASFLVGLLQHTEQADRLAAVEASRTRLAEAADAERRRIERDLHDGAQQQILALLTRVELARARLDRGDDELAGELAAIGDGLREAHRDLRELARGVHPAVLTDHGLAEAVRSVLSRLPGGVDLVIAPGLAGTRFPPRVEATAYFVVLEGVTNALKHAGTGRAVVSIATHEDLLEVAVQDAGAGFDGGNDHGSGLVGLADRLAAVGGRLEVESRAGVGTTLRGLLPLAGHAGR